ncbi:family 31 glycosyltransferase [Aspergillus aculeatinus CBS 121060]|uniref:N-acetylgalactosaminide beta-1,3-galactosyltransferase n=2 Tax=Aspergillus TaxID=5052 RepID=A0A8G1RXN9_9EURO|nr:family 31 glycosyltransferase [Aspergillus aculeatinus CBS 121060]XP_040804208.1 family 31 glycosyltransferase [Aspergillus fijiensis CBS 313.89]RAH66352.1 family 31 glycosyltransferase [Aspergillus aculeatinus CBS 121060]RAK80198.1 family 31 glycosyltransferase [Aspergillus fijiensis CBS 313.89]
MGRETGHRRRPYPTMFARKPANLLALILLFVIGASIFKVELGNGPFDPRSLYRLDRHHKEPGYWDWETTTRFSRTQNYKVDDDHICDSFPTYLLPRIQIVLKIGASEPQDRVNAHLSTVTRCISNLIVVSDRESELQGHHVHDVLATLPESFRANVSDFEAYDTLQNGRLKSVAGPQGWRLDRFKFLPMVERAHEINPTADWFVFIESDTYVVWDNMFRLLDQFNPSVPLYMGSPSPGRPLDHDEISYFAYGGSGFVLSTAAVKKLVARETGAHGEYTQPPLSEQYEDLVKADCCGDSILGWALHEKGVELSGFWPMFNPHPLHGIPFDDVHWCQPVISMHKTLISDMAGLMHFENQRDRSEPLLYADLLEYLKLGTFDERLDWDNGDWGGWQEPPESPGHASFDACRAACHDHPDCLSFTYDSTGHCVFVRTVRLGAKKLLGDANTRLSSGWDLEKIQHWRNTHQCERPLWVKPSTTRKF